MYSCSVLAKIMLVNFIDFKILIQINIKKFTDIRGNSAIQIFFRKYICDKILIKDTLS